MYREEGKKIVLVFSLKMNVVKLLGHRAKSGPNKQSVLIKEVIYVAAM